MARKSVDELIAEEQKKTEQARARIAELKARQRADERKKDSHRKIVVGAAIMAHIKIDPRFRRDVREALNKAVTEPKHRAVIPDLLDEKAFQEAIRRAAREAADAAGAKQAAVEAQEAAAEKPPAEDKPQAQQEKARPGA